MSRFKKAMIVLFVLDVILSVLDVLIACGRLDEWWRDRYERKYFEKKVMFDE